ncbi:hypothetical protein PH210_20160 [Paenibacillus sp. BSR1-1]|uniref:hypothetical protein n=1 Tax=Paenibacillus sp. BSR1-1 TaxID=3020845 RepID=UPI0025AFE525|nr:hypothetical protein [Paenibacillus sp. BSR1-1]MDN3018501.1 hypothetical protein [Paenibacillus sp. BSR1-1]
MKNRKNEQGYALVTVLVIITLFATLFLAFMGHSLNSVKQNQVVEKSSQSVALAEMGVSYYDVAIQDIFEKLKDEIKVKVENKELTTQTAVIDYLKLALKERIKNIVPPSSVGDDASFTIEKSDDKITVTSVGNKLKINLNVIGTKKDDPTNLSVEMVINNLSDIKINTTTNTATEIVFGQVTRPDIINPNCNNPQSLNLSQGNGNNGNGNNGNSNMNQICSDVLIDQSNSTNGTRSYSGNNDIDVSKIYSTIGLVFTGNINNRSSLMIYADSLNSEKNFNNGNSLSIETKHNFTIGSNVQNTDHVNLFIGGLININGHLDLSNSTNVYIRGTRTANEISNNTISTISGHLKIDSTSKMCINGDIKVTNGLDIYQDRLIIKGKVVDNNGTQINDSKIKYVTDSTDKQWLQQQCLNTFEVSTATTSNTIEWGNITNSMVNDVIYP